MGKLWRRVKYFLFRGRYQQELRDELEAHRALRQWHLERQGTDATAAAAESQRLLGSAALAREDADQEWIGSIDGWWRDVRHGLGGLVAHRGFTVTVTLTLALCLGVNAVLLSVVDSVLLRPLPLPDSDRLVLMTNAYPRVGVDSDGASVPDYTDRRRVMTVFEEQALFRTGYGAIDQSGVPTRIELMQVTPTFFRLLKVPPQLGRVFTDDEGQVGHNHAVVLSDALWHSEFGADPAALGRDMRLDGQSFRVVGVMPRAFTFLNGEVMLWTPLAFTAQERSDEARHVNQWQQLGRLRSGATVAQAQDQLDALNAANLDRFPAYKQLLAKTGFHTVATRLRDDLVKDVKRPLTLMWGGALFVLLIGCTNVANLVIVRSRVRAREWAVRMALGAGRSRLARQLVTENVLITLGSALIGLLASASGLRMLAAKGLLEIPRAAEVGLDGFVIGATLAAAVGIGIGLGALSMTSGVATGRLDALWAERRTNTATSAGQTFRRGLVVAQVSLAFLLVLGAGVFSASFRRVVSADPGFSATDVLTGSVILPAGRYPDEAALKAFTAEAIRRIRALPGVTAASVTNVIPNGGAYRDRVILAEGHDAGMESVIAPSQVIATPGFFETLRIRLKRGRLFDDRDSASSPRVAIVDERLGQAFWPGLNPLGRRLYYPNKDKDHFLATDDKTEWFTVVGVVGEIALKGVLASSSAIGTYYLPYGQHPADARHLTLAVRAREAGLVATELRRTMTALDPDLPLFDLQPLADLNARSVARPHALMLLSTGFGVVALALTGVGIYGVLSFLVTQRRREIGIRMALGGSPASVVSLVLREAGVAIVGGLLAGGAGTVLFDATLRGELFGVSAADPRALAGTAGVLLVVALVASGVPAQRAVQIDPVRTLAE